MKRKILIIILSCLISLINFNFAFCQEADNTGAEATQNPANAPNAAPEPSQPKDEKISLDLKGIDVSDLLKILSQKTGWNIVPSRQVQGRVNVYLNNVSFNDALDVIMVTNDLAADRKEGIIYVMTAEEYLQLYGQRYNEKRQVASFKLNYANPKDVFAALESLKSEIGRVIVDESSATVILIDTPTRLELMHRKVKELDQPPQAEVFDLKYAKAKDLKEQVSSSITQGAGDIHADERTNRLIVTDLPERMKKIKQMVKAFDAEHNEVFIEGEIVQIVLNKEFERGISWEKIFNQFDDLDFKGVFPVAPTSYQQISVGTLAGDKYNAVLKFLETFGSTKTISRPRIAAIDNTEAKILVGTREAYITSTVSQGSTSSTVTAENVEFIDVGIKLSVVPQVNKDNFVTMKIKTEVSSVKDTLSTSQGNEIPIVETSEAETMVKVKDGTMIMIAGLMKDEKSIDELNVPVLGKMPLIGWLFGSKDKQHQKTETIIFITPHIMSGEVSYIDKKGERVDDLTETSTSLEKVNIKLKGFKEDIEEVKGPEKELEKESLRYEK